MAGTNEALKKLQSYLAKIETETEYHTSSDHGRQAYEERLDQTLRSLKTRVDEERSRVDQVGFVTHLDGRRTKSSQLKLELNEPGIDEPAEDPRTQLAQLRVLKTAHEQLTQARPYLPDPGSPLPALLAIQNLQRLNGEIKQTIRPTYEKLKKLRADLARERAEASDNVLLTNALKSRLSRLEAEASSTVEQSQDEIATALTAAEQDKAKHYTRERARLFRALTKFVDETLAPMLAAEELGGPVAGSTANITEDMLIAGFTAKGRPKKAKKPAEDGEGRQLRIDQIWGEREEEESVFEDSPQTESDAAAKEMRTLMEELLNCAVEHGAGKYVELQRDSAAARFLVRAQVATLHRQDAMKIRLLDFGRELDD